MGSQQFGGVATNGTAQFGASSQLLSATNPSGFFVGLTLGESGAADGVIGWGRWATATDHLNTALSNFHYVIGRETPLSQLAALNGVTATYQMIGFTVPTGALGNATGSPSGTLTASFGAATMNVSMALQVPYFNSMTNTTYAVNATTGTVPLGSTFLPGQARLSVVACLAEPLLRMLVRPTILMQVATLMFQVQWLSSANRLPSAG